MPSQYWLLVDPLRYNSWLFRLHTVFGSKRLITGASPFPGPTLISGSSSQALGCKEMIHSLTTSLTASLIASEISVRVCRIVCEYSSQWMTTVRAQCCKLPEYMHCLAEVPSIQQGRVLEQGSLSPVQPPLAGQRQSNWHRREAQLTSPSILGSHIPMGATRQHKGSLTL